SSAIFPTQPQLPALPETRTLSRVVCHFSSTGCALSQTTPNGCLIRRGCSTSAALGLPGVGPCKSQAPGYWRRLSGNRSLPYVHGVKKKRRSGTPAEKGIPDIRPFSLGCFSFFPGLRWVDSYARRKIIR